MPITMYYPELQTNVDVYQFGIPDCFGCNTLVFYHGDSPIVSSLSSTDPNDPMIKQLKTEQWMTVNVKKLQPQAGSKK